MKTQPKDSQGPNKSTDQKKENYWINKRDLNWSKNLQAQLRCYAYEGRVSEVKMLLGLGINPKVCGKDGKNALHWAVMGGVESIILEISKTFKIEEVNAVDKNGQTPLHLAVRKNCLPACKILVQKGANPLIQDCVGQTALQMAQDKKIQSILVLNLSDALPYWGQI